MNPATCGRRCRVMSLVLAAVTGALFGTGLLVSGMTQPAKVLAFLDFARDWDPTLAFVMGGAVVIYTLAYRLILKRRLVPWFEIGFQLPQRRSIDRRLVIGSAIFGAGWGLAGLCPGPAIVSATSSTSALLFVAMMLIGMRITPAT